MLSINMGYIHDSWHYIVIIIDVTDMNVIYVYMKYHIKSYYIIDYKIFLLTLFKNSKMIP